jgi:hypothetical protein
MDWNDLDQDRDQCMAFVNMATFGFQKMLGNSSVAERLSASKEGLSTMELVLLKNSWLICNSHYLQNLKGSDDDV